MDEKTANAQTARALVVDDDEATAKLITTVLQRESFEVEVARNGAEAISRMGEKDYNLIVLDLVMPKVNGIAVLRYLDEHKPANLCRVIMTTASPHVIASEFLDRICRILPKPFELSLLIEFAHQCTKTEKVA
ncbi:MAG TPA: response regulator [Thermoanaerobaculia bacterium]|nr:response regulator [Thermoanaerobaculia bacterium]